MFLRNLSVSINRLGSTESQNLSDFGIIRSESFDYVDTLQIEGFEVLELWEEQATIRSCIERIGVYTFDVTRLDSISQHVSRCSILSYAPLTSPSPHAAPNIHYVNL